MGGIALIEVQNLTKVYGRHVALDHVSFTIDSGKIYGFLGPNGAGKSTTMNIITGCLAATEGTVTVDGHDIVEEPLEAQRCIGYLPELPPLYMDMTVREYLRFVAEAKRIDPKKRAAEMALAMAKTGTDGVADRLIKNLSKGYRQRVGLAQAILGDPKVIILDEPTVGLDPKQIIEIRDLIRELGRNRTVMLSSHIMQEISAVCDTLIIIAGGRLVAQDTPEHLEERAAHDHALHLTVRAEEDAFRRALNPLEGKASVRECSALDGGLLEATLEVQADEDVRETLFYALADAHCPLLALSQEKQSLEDVFLQLTAAEPPAEAPLAPQAEKEES